MRYKVSKINNFIKVLSTSFKVQIALKVLIRNSDLEPNERFLSGRLFDKRFNCNSYTSRLKVACIFTNRSRGVLPGFMLSRLAMKEYCLQGRIAGYKKARW